MSEIEDRFKSFMQVTGEAVSAAVLTLAERLDVAVNAETNGMLTVGHAAKRLGVSVATVRNLVQCGKLPASRIGKGRGTLRFDPALVKEYQAASAGNHLPIRRVVR